MAAVLEACGRVSAPQNSQEGRKKDRWTNLAATGIERSDEFCWPSRVERNRDGREQRQRALQFE
jgi:hypothetical protein